LLLGLAPVRQPRHSQGPHLVGHTTALLDQRVLLESRLGSDTGLEIRLISLLELVRLGRLGLPSLPSLFGLEPFRQLGFQQILPGLRQFPGDGQIPQFLLTQPDASPLLLVQG